MNPIYSGSSRSVFETRSSKSLWIRSLSVALCLSVWTSFKTVLLTSASPCEIEPAVRKRSGYGMASVTHTTRSILRTRVRERSWISKGKALSFLATALPEISAEPNPETNRGRCRPSRPVPFTWSIVTPTAANRSSTGQSLTGNKEQKGGQGTGCTVSVGSSSGMETYFSWVDSVSSTMDEAKNIIAQGVEGKDIVAVAAREQLNGRGTKGRTWMSLPGNVFLTVAVPLDRVPVPLSLIPLRVGTLIAPEITKRLHALSTRLPDPVDQQSPARREVSLKWPNDVLLGGKKVAGVLIEAELPFLLVGIGVNMRHKPEVAAEGPQRGRPAASMAEHGAITTDEAVKELTVALTEALCRWVAAGDSGEVALSEWRQWVDWEMPLEIRDDSRPVTPLGVAPDGRLRVKDMATGREELLVTEYPL
ncbi:unnamed protein product [Discosporangium mesarthrocarpum]